MFDAAKDKIAVLNDKFYGGGTERILSYLSTRVLFDKEEFIFLFDNSRIDFEYVGNLVSLSIKAPPYSNMLSETFFQLKALFRLMAAKRKYKIKICISQKEGPNFINVLSSYKSKPIVTVHEHKSVGIKYKGIKRLIVKYLIKYIYNRACYVVAVSQGIAQDLNNNFGIKNRKLKVIYNPCDIEMIESKTCEDIDNEYKCLFNSRVILTAGRLETQKGHWHLIRAFKEVRQKINNIRLVILGDGSHLNYLQNLALSFGLENSIHFLGYQENPFKFMSKADVFILTSLWEGFGAVITEAMACKVPVISTDCPSGPREILAPDSNIESQSHEIEYAKYGVLTPPLDGIYKLVDDPLTYGEKALAEAIIRVLEDSDLRKKYAALGYLRAQEFSMEKYIAQWNEAIVSL